MISLFVILVLGRDFALQHVPLAGWRGILRTDAYGGYDGLYDPVCPRGPVTSTLCWSHARRDFFEFADIAASALQWPRTTPVSLIALGAVKCINALLAIEYQINVLGTEGERGRLSRSFSVAQPINCMF